jgi:hypothetical protein
MYVNIKVYFEIKIISLLSHPVTKTGDRIPAFLMFAFERFSGAVCPLSNYNHSGECDLGR